jgi:hypothetical protein
MESLDCVRDLWVDSFLKMLAIQQRESVQGIEENEDESVPRPHALVVFSETLTGMCKFLELSSASSAGSREIVFETQRRQCPGLFLQAFHFSSTVTSPLFTPASSSSAVSCPTTWHLPENALSHKIDSVP